MSETIIIDLDADAGARLEISFDDAVEVAKGEAEAYAFHALAELMGMPGVKSKRFKTCVVLVESGRFAMVAAVDTEKLEAKVRFVASPEAARKFNAELARRIGLDQIPGVPRFSDLPSNPFRQH